VTGPRVEVDLDEAARLATEAGPRWPGQPALALTAAEGALDLLGRGPFLADEPDTDWALPPRREAEAVRAVAMTLPPERLALAAVGGPRTGLCCWSSTTSIWPGPRPWSCSTCCSAAWPGTASSCWPPSGPRRAPRRSPPWPTSAVAELAAASGSDYLLAQVAPPAQARAARDRIAAALPSELRPAFLRHGYLASVAPGT
jgi:hypothetical protein